MSSDQLNKQNKSHGGHVYSADGIRVSTETEIFKCNGLFIEVKLAQGGQCMLTTQLVMNNKVAEMVMEQLLQLKKLINN